MAIIGDLGIKARLVLLMAAAVAPLFLLLSGGVVYFYGDALDRAEIDVRRTADIAADRFAHVFEDARSRLDMARNLDEVRGSGGPACDAFLTALQRSHPPFLRIGLIDRNGTPTCRGQIGAAAVPGDRAFLDRVLDMPFSGFAIGAFKTETAAERNAVLTAMPFFDAQGEAAGAIYAVVDLHRLTAFVSELSSAGQRSVLLMEAGTARVLARWPSPVAFATVLPDHPALPFIRSHPEGGAAALTDLDGTSRSFGAAPVGDKRASDIILLVGEPRAETIAAFNFRSLIAVLLALAALGLAIAGTCWLGSEMQVRPIRHLMRMASRIGAGEFEARTEIERWQAPEFRELGSTLDAMAARLHEGREAEKAVAASESRYRLLADNTADMITCINAEGVRTFVSGASFNILGYRPDELLGQRPRDIAHPDDLWIIDALSTCIQTSDNVPASRYRVRHRDGHYVWVEVGGRRIHGSTEMVLAVRDASHRKAMEDHLEVVNQRLALLAATDDLTGLPNRRTFNETLTNELIRCAGMGTSISVALIDVDRFKAFNDGYGHQAGDVCLKSVAGALRCQVGRAGDLVARYGGEEFVAVFPSTALSAALVRADAMRLAIRDLEIPHDGSEHGRVTVSIGVACLVDAAAADAAGALLRQADQALYAAKARGRDAIEAFCVEAADASIRRPA